jgi:2-polyprenyl-6-methoxyphenol hydroxylase-like FAD-dependent oxidoreductase
MKRVTGFRDASRDVVIAGSGIGGAAVAIRLSSVGFRPTLTMIPRVSTPAIEAIPETALPLFRELEIERTLHQAGAAMVDGFENRWWSDTPSLIPGRWIHVDRSRLAAAVLREAMRRGARLRVVRVIPRLRMSQHAVSCDLGERESTFGAAIDATGRAAVWSRPIDRLNNAIAALFRTRTSAALSCRGRVMRFDGGWAYRLGHPDFTTVAVVSSRRPGTELSATLRKALDIRSEAAEWIGYRPAFCQWSCAPIVDRRIAIGDAALAHDPIAGQGIRFALASAVAAAAVVNTWTHGSGTDDGAARYYERFVDDCRRRHTAFLRHYADGASPAAREPASLPTAVVFSGTVIRADVQVGSRIRLEEAVVMRDERLVRWVGGVDVLRVRDFARRAVPVETLIARLATRGCTRSSAAALVTWCVERQLLTPVERISGTPDLKVR